MSTAVGVLECAEVRLFVTSLLSSIVLFSALASSPAWAEVIHLRNGRTIWADRVREEGDRLDYEIGDSSYAIPKSMVERIEAGGIPADAAASETSLPSPIDAATLAPPDAWTSQSSVADKIIHDNAVDEDALAAVEKQGNAAQTAVAYYLAGKHEYAHANFVKSRRDFEAALGFDSENPAILTYYAALLVRTNNAALAVPKAEKAVRLAPDSPDALAVLGYAQYATDRNRDAIRTWERSLALRPDANLQQYLAKAEHESTVETNFSERESSHFTLRYEGRKTEETLRAELISALESDYDELVRELGIAPPSSIPVILYTDQSFFDVTQAPSWSGAVNDGKLRIPVQGMNSVSPDLARVLKHELAHSFINQLSGGRCPQWLNEGIAQALEPKSLAASGSRLAELFAEDREIPLNLLEGSFMRLSPSEATLAYDESLAAVLYIEDTYGMSDLERILERLGQGSSVEAALRSTIHSDYKQMDSEIRFYLRNKYGG
jgi:tetratricopeptide (TPR) repeat protein